MSQLDDELRNALRREEPPEGFVNRVLERLPAEPPRATVARPGMARTWLAAAAALVLAAGAIWVALPRPQTPEVGKFAPPKPVVVNEPPHSAPPPVPPAPPAPPTTAPITTTPSTTKRPPRPIPRRDRDDAEALHAAEQLRTALGVTSEKFRLTQREVREALVVPES